MTDRQFDPKRVRRWRRDVWRAFQRDFSPAELMAVLVLAAVASFGTDVDVLSELTGNSPDYVRKVLRRLRKSGVLRGQTLRTDWQSEGHNGFQGNLAVVLDAGVAAGVFVRGVDEKRSAGQKARSPETRARGQRGARTKMAPGAVFTPKMQKSNPLYGLPEWKAHASATSVDAVDPSASDSGTLSTREKADVKAHP